MCSHHTFVQHLALLLSQTLLFLPQVYAAAATLEWQVGRDSGVAAKIYEKVRYMEYMEYMS